MADFSITSALRLQKPANLDKISSLIRNKLENISVKIDTKLDRAAVRKVDELNKSLKQTSKNTDVAADSMESFGRQTAITIKRFGAYTLVTAGFFRFISAVTDGIKEAIDFQDELIKISQVTGQSVFALSTLTREIDRLSTTLGVSSKELLNSSRVLAQAGFSAQEVKTALQTLAKTDLAPTFDNLNDTTEGVIASFKQFGFGIDELEDKFSSINAVSAKFAVESGDISAAIRRTGGAFSAAGGSVEELIGLFTSVRATTRESAESIATGFRTIFTRIQRARTQNSLRELGIDLQNSEGLFVGPFEAIKRLSDALGELGSNDPRFPQIVEELGGFRQIGKVIPLIQQASTAQAAYGVALRGTNSLTEDAEKRQESLAIKIEKVREEFQKLLRTVGDSQAFKILADVLLSVTKSLNSLANSLAGVLPALIPLIGPGIARSTSQFATGLTKTLGSSRGVNFAKGGQIGGSGNKDTELIATTPGEFVIKKSSVQKYGTGFLNNLNEGKVGKFADGGLTGGLSLSGPRLAATAGVAAVSVPSITELAGLGDTAQDLEKSFKNVILQSSILFAALTFGNSKIEDFSQKIEKSSESVLENEQRYDALNKDIKTRSQLINQTQSSIKTSEAKERALVAGFEKERALPNIIAGSGRKGYGRAVTSVINQERTARGVRKGLLTELEKERSIIQEKQVELKKQIDLEKASQAANQKSIRTTQILNAGLAATAAGLSVFGQTLQNWSQENLESFREGRGFDESQARTQAVAGGALSGAGFGGLAGAGFATAIGGPVGLLAAAGAISLSLFQANEALSGFNKELSQIKVEKISETLSTSLSSLSDGTGPRAVSNQINESVRRLSSQLIGEQDQDIATSLSSTLESSVSELINFVDASKNVSTSLSDLEDIVSRNTLQTIADRTGKTLSEYRTSLAESIQKIQEENEGREEAIRRNRAFEIAILSQRALNVAAKSAASSLDSLTSGISVLSGELNFGSGATGAFEKIAGGVNPAGASQDILSFANNFGSAAELLGKKSIEAANAVEVLPNILLRLRAADPLGQKGDFANRLGNELAKSNIGDEVSGAILDQVSEIIGAEGKDVTIIKQLNENFLETINKITSGLIERNAGLFSELEASSVEALRKFNDGLSKGAGILSSITDRRLQINTNNRGFQNTLSGVTGQTNFRNLRQLDRRRTDIVTGGRDQNQLFRQLNQSTANQKRLRESLSETGSLKERKNIIIALNEEAQKIQNVNRALDFLSDVSARTATAQQQLQKATEDRNKRGGILRDIAFGGKEQNATLSRNVAAAKLLEVIPNINQIPVQFRGEVRGFLERLGDTSIGGLGKTGNEILRRIELNFAKQAGIDPRGIITASEKEQKLLDEIKTATELGNQIESGRINQEQVFLNELNTNLSNNFNAFLEGLKGQIDRIFEQERQQKATAIRGDINVAKAGIRQGIGIRNITGLDPQTVLNNFDRIKKSVNTTKSISDQIGSIDTFSKGFDFNAFAAAKPGDSVSEVIRNVIRSSASVSPELSDLLGQKFRAGSFSNIPGIKELEASYGTEGFSKLGVEARDAVTRGIAREFIESLQGNIKDGLKTNLEAALSTRGEIIGGIGGAENFKAIAGNISKLEPIITSLPKDTSFVKLYQNLATLNQELRILNSNNNRNPRGGPPIGRNSGGIIPGHGNSDTVSARLTPGEYVMNKGAVQRFGVGVLERMNKQGFNNGGLVKNNVDMSAINAINMSMNKFSIAADRLSSAISNIPSEISLRGSYKLEIVHVGAQIFSSLEPKLAEYVTKTVDDGLNRLIDQKFPEVGPLS